MRDGFGVAGASAPAFAEPDIEQRWITGQSTEGGRSLAQPCGAPDPQNPDFPRDIGNNYWFRAASHSQFNGAIDAIAGPDVASKVRIAHFDTGYDPNHRTLPKRLRRDIGRNFVEDDNPGDASDQTSGLFTNLGHGTGTLSILAGTALPGQPPVLGGAPFAEIVPVRVANRVVLFSNSSIAQAFDYVHKLNVAGANRVDIITMSMGGLASQAWADAVNALYEQGVFIVTAAGNNFGNLPTHNIVYPARSTVVAACGVMANGNPMPISAFPDGGQLRPRQQDGDGDRRADTELALGAFWLQRYRRLRWCRNVGGDTAGRRRGGNLAAESRRRRRLSASLDESRSHS
jgi:subtilisin family serine protease